MCLRESVWSTMSRSACAAEIAAAGCMRARVCFAGVEMESIHNHTQCNSDRNKQKTKQEPCHTHTHTHKYTQPLTGGRRERSEAAFCGCDGSPAAVFGTPVARFFFFFSQKMRCTVRARIQVQRNTLAYIVNLCYLLLSNQLLTCSNVTTESEIKTKHEQPKKRTPFQRTVPTEYRYQNTADIESF